jgi:hypothetical protein
MKTRNYDLLVIGIMIGTLATVLIDVLLSFAFAFSLDRENKSPEKSYKAVGGNIDIEYYLEVSEDSIWVEGVQSKKVYSGKYSDLDSLINVDNL